MPLCVSNTNTHMVQPLHCIQIYRFTKPSNYLAAFEQKWYTHGPRICQLIIPLKEQEESLLLHQARTKTARRNTDGRRGKFQRDIIQHAISLLQQRLKLDNAVKVMAKRSLEQNVGSRLDLITLPCTVTLLTPRPPSQQNRLKSYSSDHRGPSQQLKSQMESLVIVAS